MRDRARWLIVAVGLGLLGVYLLVPVQKDLRLIIWTRSGPFDMDTPADAQTYIEDVIVGGPRVELSFGQLKQYLAPADDGATWPPSGSDSSEYDSAITPSLQFDVRRQPDNDHEPKVHQLFVRVIDGKQVLQGTLHIKVVNSKGQTAYCAGSGLESQSVEDKRISATVKVQMHF